MQQQTYHPLISFDESGDPGMNKGQSLPYFTLVGVMFERNDQADAYAEDIAAVRAARGLPATFEFHFRELKADLRRAFLESAAAHSFLYTACTVEKEKLYGVREWRKNSFFYSQVVATIVKGLKDPLLIARATKGQPLCAKAHADGAGNRAFHDALKKGFGALKDDDGRALVEKIRFGNSASWPLLQLADMVCGAVTCLRDGEREFHQIIRCREVAHAILAGVK